MTTAPTRDAAVPRQAMVGIFGGLFAGYLGLTAVIPVLPASCATGTTPGTSPSAWWSP